jgi:hypothetical protein
LRILKDAVRNKARVEGSIVSTYVIDEISSFCSNYFASDVPTRSNRPDRHYDGGETSNIGGCSIFKSLGRGKMPHRVILSEVERNAAHHYVLMNCKEIESYRM